MNFYFKFKSDSKIVFSLPQTNHYQEIANLKIFSLNTKIIKDSIWNNKILLINPNKENKETKIFFNLIPKIYQIDIDNNLTIDDYQKSNFKVINNQFINGQNQHIKSLAKKITGDEKNLKRVIYKLYNFTLNYLTYGQPTEGLYTYYQGLKDKVTDCGGFATFLGSLCQYFNIPTRLVVGFLIKNNPIKNFFSNFKLVSLDFNDLLIHAWLEIKLPNKTWFSVDPSIEWRRNKKLTNRQGGFGYIPNDRLVVSFGCDFKIKINHQLKKIDLLQKPVFLV